MQNKKQNNQQRLASMNRAKHPLPLEEAFGPSGHAVHILVRNHNCATIDPSVMVMIVQKPLPPQGQVIPSCKGYIIYLMWSYERKGWVVQQDFTISGLPIDSGSEWDINTLRQWWDDLANSAFRCDDERLNWNRLDIPIITLDNEKALSLSSGLTALAADMEVYPEERLVSNAVEEWLKEYPKAFYYEH